MLRLEVLHANLLIAATTFQEALDIVHVSKENQESVFAMLAAVLWLGNVSFSVVDNENHVEPMADEGKVLSKIG
jgi:myosin heavy subunit